MLHKLSPQATALAIAWRDGAKSLQGHGAYLHEDGTARVLGPTERLRAHRCNQAPVARTVGENQLCQLCILLQGIGGHAEWLRWIRSLCGPETAASRQAVYEQATAIPHRSSEAARHCSSTATQQTLIQTLLVQAARLLDVIASSEMLWGGLVPWLIAHAEIGGGTWLTATFSLAGLRPQLRVARDRLFCLLARSLGRVEAQISLQLHHKAGILDAGKLSA